LQDVTATVRIAEDPRELATADVLVLTVKTYDMLSALGPLRHVRVTSAFSIQNGVVKDDQLAAAFGGQAVLGAAADFSGEVMPDGAVQFTRNEGLYIGELPHGTSDRVHKIAAPLRSVGLKTTASDNIQTVEWSKYAGWLALTPLAVLTRLPTCQVLKNPELARLQTVLAREAARLAEHLSIPLSPRRWKSGWSSRDVWARRWRRAPPDTRCPRCRTLSEAGLWKSKRRLATRSGRPPRWDSGYLRWIPATA
jgi:ketopantoate reductase